MMVLTRRRQGRIYLSGLLAAGFLSLVSCGSEKAGPEQQRAAETEAGAADVPMAGPQSVELVVFSNDSAGSGTGWGYDVFLDSSLYIHQPIIPAVAGDQGFSTAADARKAGGLVSHKIRNNIMPPSVTLAELDSLGVALPER